jgi:cobalt/nickel transport system permease protein
MPKIPDNPAVPSWLVGHEPYEPPKDRGRFLEKSLLSVMGAMVSLRERPSQGRLGELVRPELKLASAFLLILLASLSRSAFFLEAVAAFELLWLSLLPGKLIARILRKVVVAALFALAIFLPAILIGRGADMPALVAKILLAVLAAALLSATTSWPSMASALAAFRVPDVFVMTLDMTVKYITLLGGLVLDMLFALKLRSVGRDERKTDSLAAIAGTVFLKSKEAAEEEYGAMECRCFSGTYRSHARRKGFSWRDWAFAAANVALLGSFAFFGMGHPLWGSP